MIWMLWNLIAPFCCIFSLNLNKSWTITLNERKHQQAKVPTQTRSLGIADVGFLRTAYTFLRSPFGGFCLIFTIP